MSILEYNGGAVVAMLGKNCVAVASDLRYGIKNTTVGCQMRKAYPIHQKCLLGMAGLATDVQTFLEKMKFRVNMYKLREDRDIKPSSFGNMVSSALYENRFGPMFLEPVIAGLEGDDNTPFISSTDLIGAQCFTDNFVVVGTASEALYGMCESLWKPEMEPEDLFEVISQCLMASVDRDCNSGWGGIVYILTPDKLITKELKGRQD
ncbi:proteasome subunit beta-3 [Acrasis kona]|uniref:Proteasome subunit beta n=1 Tax=Acrasis kona TaxID=1008807 RepID=A0AAW2YYQ1_9EUKA